MAAGEALRALLDSAHEALLAGDAPDAERRARAVSAIVRAERDVAEHRGGKRRDARRRCRSHSRRTQKPLPPPQGSRSCWSSC